MEAGHPPRETSQSTAYAPADHEGPAKALSGALSRPADHEGPGIRPRGRGAPSGPPRASSELRRDRYPRPALRGAARRRGQPGQPGQPGGGGRPETCDGTPSRSREHARPRPRPRATLARALRRPHSAPAALGGPGIRPAAADAPRGPPRSRAGAIPRRPGAAAARGSFTRPCPALEPSADRRTGGPSRADGAPRCTTAPLR